MQDRYRRIDEILLRRTAGPYIWVIRYRGSQQYPPFNVRFSPFATILHCVATCREVPQADSAPQQTPPLFNYFVSAGEQRRRHREPERVGGLQVDHQLEVSRLQHRHFRRI
jgi:hypothetical protein